MRVLRLLLMWSIRYTPLPWWLKLRLIWLFTAKVALSACAFIEDDQGRLLVLRSRYSGEWQLPGGSVDRGETVGQALRRECHEELGCELAQMQLQSIVPVLGGLTHIALYRAGLAPGAIRLSDEHTEYRYLAPGELPAHLRRMLNGA